MRTWSSKTKDEARRLRLEGKTYSELITLFGVPKSTLHYWMVGIDRPPEIVDRSRENWLGVVQKMGAQANKKKRTERLERLRADVGKDILDDEAPFFGKKTILAMLYWAEGAKGRNEVVNFANTDPQMILLFVNLLRECFRLQESKFRVRLHLHYYHNERAIKKYWSSHLGIPERQFTKTYRKKRGSNKTYRRNEYGICFLKYNSMALKEELLFWAHLLADRILAGPNEAKKQP